MAIKKIIISVDFNSKIYTLLLVKKELYVICKLFFKILKVLSQSFF